MIAAAAKLGMVPGGTIVTPARTVGPARRRRRRTPLPAESTSASYAKAKHALDPGP